MTRSERIRQAITAAGKPLSCRQLCAAVPGKHTASAVTAMVKDGYLRRSGMPQSYLYSIGKASAPRVYGRTPEERRALKNARDRRRWAEMATEKKRAVEARKRRAAPPKRRPKGIAIAPSRSVKLPPPIAPSRESVEAWMKRTGQRPEVLPGFTVTRPRTLAA